MCIAPLRERTSKFSGMARIIKGSHCSTCTPQVHPLGNEPYLPFPSQPKLVLIYRRWRDGRLHWPGWLVTYRDKCLALGIEPGHGHPSLL